MNRRSRLPAALLALFALSAYLGEGVWSPLCPPEMEVHAAAADADPAPHAGMHHAPAGSDDESGDPRSDAPPCPLGMAGAGSTCVAASLPAVAAAAGAPALDRTPVLAYPDHTHDRLLVAAHFRPPRA